MTGPNKYQISLLRLAVTYLKEEDYIPYFDLKRLLAERHAGFKTEFRRIFEHYYGLNTGGITDTFKARYFELLFDLVLHEGVDPYTLILKELYDIPRRKLDNALQCSFVSKLIAIHDEAYPIFDRHVSKFFGVTVPTNGSIDFRIAGFVANLEWLRETYQLWSVDSQFQKIVLTVKQKHPLLEDCSDPRIADFLVWTVGRNKLGDKLTMDS